MKPTLTSLVKNTTARFVCYRDGDLWYRIVRAESIQPVDSETKTLFEFPVPISDTGTGIFPNEVKAINLMRWIRKQLEKVNKGEWG